MAVDIENLAFSWKDKEKPLIKIDKLGLQQGDKLLVKGPSGSGKSTLLSLLSGFQLPTSGEIKICGTIINSLSASDRDQFRADHMGYIFQMFNLIPYLSVLENVILPISFSQRKQGKFSSQDQIKNEANRLLTNLGLKSFGSKKVGELSVGQQQRVAAARSLMGAPEIILADEPTSALDDKSRSNFMELLFSECENNKSTLIYVSHENSIEKFFNNVHRIERSV